MKKRILFLTMLLIAVMVFTTVLLAESPPNLHVIDRGGGGGCFVTASGVGTSVPDNTPAGVCFQATASGPAGATVTNVTVDVAATHTWIGDLVFSVNSADATNVLLLDRPGLPVVNATFGDNDDLVAAAPITFDDASVNPAEGMGDGSTATNIVVCQQDGVCDYTPENALSTLAGENVDGTWEFCVADNAAGDTGSISTFDFNITCNVPAVPGIAFTKTVGIDPNACAATDTITVTAGANVTYCYYMTNTGTVTAELHTVVDDQLGTVLGPDFPATVGPAGSAFFTVTTSINATTVNSATWSTTDAAGGNGVSASDSATVNVNQPTSVSLSSFDNGPAAFTPVWLAGLFAILVAAGFILRRKWIRVE